MEPSAGHIYSEEIYRTREPLTIVISAHWKDIPENQKQLLDKILHAIGQSLESIRIIRQSAYDASESAGTPSHVIGFVTPPKGVSLYELYRTNQTAVIFADGLDILAGDESLKRKLWTALKQFIPA